MEAEKEIEDAWEMLVGEDGAIRTVVSSAIAVTLVTLSL